MRLAESLHDRACHSVRWAQKTGQRAAALAEVFQAFKADLAPRKPRRAKHGPGQWIISALADTGERVAVASVRAPILRRWDDDCAVHVLVHRAHLLAGDSVRALDG